MRALLTWWRRRRVRQELRATPASTATVTMMPSRKAARDAAGVKHRNGEDVVLVITPHAHLGVCLRVRGLASIDVGETTYRRSDQRDALCRPIFRPVDA